MSMDAMSNINPRSGTPGKQKPSPYDDPTAYLLADDDNRSQRSSHSSLRYNAVLPPSRGQYDPLEIHNVRPKCWEHVWFRKIIVGLCMVAVLMALYFGFVMPRDVLVEHVGFKHVHAVVVESAELDQINVNVTRIASVTNPNWVAVSVSAVDINLKYAGTILLHTQPDDFAVPRRSTEWTWKQRLKGSTDDESVTSAIRTQCTTQKNTTKAVFSVDISETYKLTYWWHQYSKQYAAKIDVLCPKFKEK